MFNSTHSWHFLFSSHGQSLMQASTFYSLFQHVFTCDLNFCYVGLKKTDVILNSTELATSLGRRNWTNNKLYLWIVKNLPAIQETLILIPGSGRSLGEGNSNPLQYSCLENHMVWWDWKTVVHSVTNRHNWSNLACTHKHISDNI